MASCIVILVGLPACGKSTLAQMIMDHQYVLNRYPKVIELDCYFQKVPNAIDIEGKWHKTRSLAFEDAKIALASSNTTVVIDDTNEYRSMRKLYFRLAQMKQYGYLEVHFKNFSFHLSVVRDGQRASPVGADSIMNVAQRIEWTDATGSGLWLVQYEQVEQVLEAIVGVKVPEPLQLAETLIVQCQNDKHIVDLQLRKCLKDLIEVNPVLKTQAKQLNEIRKQVLEPDLYDGNDYLNEFLRRVNSELN